MGSSATGRGNYQHMVFLMAIGVGNKKKLGNGLGLVHLAKIGGFPGTAYTYWNIKEDNISQSVLLAHMAIISFFAEFDQQCWWLSLLLLKSYRSETKVVIFWMTGYFADQNRAILPTAYTQVRPLLYNLVLVYHVQTLTDWKPKIQSNWYQLFLE